MAEVGTPVVRVRPEALDWDKGGGLVPAIVQDAGTHRVLMLGYMNRESLVATLFTGRVIFYSRSRKRLWVKGEKSGHGLSLVSLDTDCDADALLVRAVPNGPTCHLGSTSCFEHASGSAIADLDRLIASRASARPRESYTTQLLAQGLRRIAQKVGEEGVETALAAVMQDEAALAGEAADLLYHLLVLLHARGIGLRDLEAVLVARRESSGGGVTGA